MFSRKVIFIFGLIAFCLICSAGAKKKKETKIKTIKRVIQGFLLNVHYGVDGKLGVPHKEYWKFTGTRHRYYKFGWYIRNKEEYKEDFLLEYHNLVERSKAVIKKYLEEIEDLVSRHYNVGNPKSRKTFCDKYTTEYFDKKLKLHGYYENDNEEIRKLEKEFKGDASSLVLRIANLRDLLILPQQVGLQSNGANYTSTSAFGGTNVLIMDMPDGGDDGGGGFLDLLGGALDAVGGLL